MPAYKIATTLEEAAIAIRQSSFAVYTVPNSTAQAIRDGWLEAVNVLNHPPDKNSSTPEKWTRIVKGHLYGYNEPSKSKRLFRAFPSSTFQPWPNDRFRRLSLDLGRQLHDVLLESYGHLLQSRFLDGSTKGPSSSPPNNLAASSRKRRRVGICSMDGSPPRIDPLKCPLDYFLYHNLQPTATNCSAHVDRGLLIAVCLTGVPGLEIHLPSTSKEVEDHWVCPEVDIHNSNLYRELEVESTPSLICIMAGGQLSQSIGEEIPPCLHRVRDNLKRSRLSISYELRA